ncbi:uncharacterized protein LOC116177779 isoform X2 [Photinus pyralis]|uniref:uncharacterized protein LOC116177779 isoform X2 n=1 Tax=Photinus pyralis TaxID=7054 RepID=UPI00126755BC|nr:uncharacterized protein LOC116177779 isoform X2 [Photinus pyralis]
MIFLYLYHIYTVFVITGSKADSKEKDDKKKPGDKRDSSEKGNSSEEDKGGKGGLKEKDDKKKPGDKRDSSEKGNSSEENKGGKGDSKEKDDQKKPDGDKRDSSEKGNSSEEDKGDKQDSSEKGNSSEEGQGDKGGSKEKDDQKKPGDKGDSKENNSSEEGGHQNDDENTPDKNCTHCKNLRTIYDYGGCRVLCRGKKSHCPTKYTCISLIDRYMEDTSRCMYNNIYYRLGHVLSGSYPNLNNIQTCSYVCRYDSKLKMSRFVEENCRPVDKPKTRLCKDVINMNMPFLLETKLGVKYSPRTCKIELVTADPSLLPESNCVAHPRSGRCCYMYDRKYSRRTVLPPNVANCTCTCPPLLECH